MLDLVLAHRHQVGAIEQDVRGHQDRIVEQARRDALDLLRLIFELRHPLQLAERRDGVEQPLQLACSGTCDCTNSVARDGIDAGAEQADRHVAGACARRAGS